MRDLLIQIVCTGWWFFILSIVWQVLELLFLFGWLAGGKV